MTDRVAHLTVVLTEDMRVDDVEGLMDAIRMMSFVADVEMGKPLTVGDLIERSRIRREIAEKVVRLIVDGKVA